MENQNTNSNEPQNDIYELLRKVVETNEDSVNQAINLKITIEDFINLMGEAESTIRGTGRLIENAVKNIPKSTELVLSEETKNSLNKNTEQHRKNRFREYFTLITSTVALMIIIFVGKLAINWYSESIRTKTEIRQEILDEMKKDGKAIYEIKDYYQLKYNTDLMNKWMKKNPKDGEKFMKFKEGFESR